MNPKLRGKCKQYAQRVCESDPTLTLVRGWYHDPIWGSQEHWWATKPDGTIVDPTAEQFSMGSVPGLYEEFAGTYPCVGCGTEVEEADLYQGGFCSGECYARTVLGYVP